MSSILSDIDLTFNLIGSTVSLPIFLNDENEKKIIICDHCGTYSFFKKKDEQIICSKCSRIGLNKQKAVKNQRRGVVWSHAFYKVGETLECNCGRNHHRKISMTTTMLKASRHERIFRKITECVCGTKNVFIYLNRDSVYKYYGEEVSSENNLYLSFIAKPLFDSITPKGVKKVFKFSSVNKVKDFLK